MRNAVRWLFVDGTELIEFSQSLFLNYAQSADRQGGLCTKHMKQVFSDHSIAQLYYDLSPLF
jgi:hypothetical protein